MAGRGFSLTRGVAAAAGRSHAQDPAVSAAPVRAVRSSVRREEEEAAEGLSDM
ncbi:hypothetical protein GCM10017674_77270 [Streptomyces gardneri]|uniref:Uncharacterized protein n=1 Tax=Streptomyces gardneri TaxID=66892 RepID=A0A4Y3RW50_9ACTN|nr:hypothetical protein SGA01_57750 [Streptomyces gardneri]GHH21921.1 hypothetical protein GCM10017674_77270 [Streptomyces gardneri]